MHFSKKRHKKILFIGTSDFSANILIATIKGNYLIKGVITKRDNITQSKKKTLCIKKLARLNNFPCFQPFSLNNNYYVVKIIEKIGANTIVLASYGLKLPKRIIQNIKYGCINIHLSLLPKWRGAIPIKNSIESSEKETGISIIKMDKNLDTGRKLLQSKINIHRNDTRESLSYKATKRCIVDVPKSLSDAKRNKKSISFQIGKSSYANKLNKYEYLIDWKLPAKAIIHKIKAFHPKPYAYINLNNIVIKVTNATVLTALNIRSKIPGEIINITEAGIDIQSGTDIVRISRAQAPGKKMLFVKELMNGYNLRKYISLIL